MVSARQRASKAAAALGLAAGASLCSNHGVGAFYIPLVFAPRQISRVTRSAEGVQPTASFSTAGRGHRFYVRERAGSEVQLGLGSRRDSVLGRARGLGEGSRKGSRLWMLVDEDATSPSGHAAVTGVLPSPRRQGGEAVESFMPAPLQDALPEGVQAELAKINSDPVKLAFVLNAVVLFLFAAFAAYKLATVDGDIARGWTWYEVLLRVPGDNFYRYEATVSENPIVTKALTSCVAYGLGDLTAQLFTGKDLETIDLKRTGRSATAGLLIHGPLCHFWIQLMQTYLDFEGAWWNFIPKVIADQTVWSVFLNAAYSTMIMSLQGLAPSEVWGEVKSTAWPALTSSWRFWPLIHCFSFSNVIPTDLKLLFIDCMEIIWVTILSTVANKDRKPGDEDELTGTPALANGEEGMNLAPAVVMEPEKSEAL